MSVPVLSDNEILRLFHQLDALHRAGARKSRWLAGLAGAWAGENWVVFMRTHGVPSFVPHTWTLAHYAAAWWACALLLTIGPLATIIAIQKITVFIATETWKRWPVFIGWQAFCAACRR